MTRLPIIINLRFIGHVLRLLYLILETLTSPLKVLRMTVAALCHTFGKGRVRQWGGSQWIAFNMETAAVGYGLPYRMVSGIAAERAPLYPRYKKFQRFIDWCSEDGHCLSVYKWEQKVSLDAQDEAIERLRK